MPEKKILFLIGSPNQTTQMHQISAHLSDFDCYFSQIFDNDPVVQWGIKRGWLEHTVLSGNFKQMADAYLKKHQLKNDFEAHAHQHPYDLVVCCSDIIVPSSLDGIKKIWVQEGMIDKVSWRTWVVKHLKLYRWLTLDTSLNGSSNLCDIYCAASEGYKKLFSSMGTDENKIIATGMPNHDNLSRLNKSAFPHKNFVLVATSDIRECFGYDNRRAFIKHCVKIADGRKLIFKLHPNEKIKRATQEVNNIAPSAIIYTEGDIHQMIAHCEVLITQFSTVVYAGMALGKKVYSYFSTEHLEATMPLQNEGTSAATIASICRGYIHYSGSGSDYIKEHSNNNNEHHLKIQFIKKELALTI